MKNILSICFIICMIITGYLSKVDRGGFISRGGSSRGRSISRGGSSRGSFYSKPSPSNPRPSGSSGWSYSKPASSPAFSSAPAPTYGWNIKSTHTAQKPNIGGNVGSNNPVGPPPAYPGLQNKPVSSNNAPPSYSPSYTNPPAYNPSHYNPPVYSGQSNSTNNRQAISPSNSKPSYPTGNGYNRGNSYNSQPSHGSTAGSSGLPSNIHIHNNYYGSSDIKSKSSKSDFLTNALLYSAGYQAGQRSGSKSSQRSWNYQDERRWRATTKGPYFENKVPGSEKILPAAAVVGAATAFGLVSLLPLNVPIRKPLMYCNDTDIAQSSIKFEEKTYQCVNGTITLSCLKKKENETIVDECKGQTMKCNIENDLNNIYCTNGTMKSRVHIFCNSTTLLNETSFWNGTFVKGTALNETFVNKTTIVLNCYKGRVPQAKTVNIPTTSPKTRKVGSNNSSRFSQSFLLVIFLPILIFYLNCKQF